MRGGRDRRAGAKRAVALAALVAACVASGASGAAADTAPGLRDGTHDYVVTRNGRELGTHAITYRHTEHGLVVEHRVRILVKVLFVTAYRYEADRTETWEDDRLIGVHTRTNDNGTAMEVTTKRVADGLLVHGTAGSTTVAAGVGVPGPGWNAFTPGRHDLIDADSGRILHSEVAPAEDDVLDLGGRATKCRRVRITGGFDATVWFGLDGLVLKERMRARDGSTVETTLK